MARNRQRRGSQREDWVAGLRVRRTSIGADLLGGSRSGRCETALASISEPPGDVRVKVCTRGIEIRTWFVCFLKVRRVCVRHSHLLDGCGLQINPG
jgi:hypothetical protein